MNKTRALPQNFVISAFLAKYGFLVILAVMVIASSLLSPAFLTGRNIMNVLRQMSIITIIGFGVTMIIITGGIDLSPGSVVALTGVLATSMYVHTQNIWLGLIAGLLAGALVGFTNGFFITYFSLPPFIVTLAMMTGARGLALLFTGGYPIINIGDFTIFGQGYTLGIPNPILIMLLVMIIIMVLVKRTRFGRYIYAIGGNETAAMASGVNVRGIKMATYTIASSLVGLSGVLLMSRINSGQPAAGLMFELDAITCAVIGGTSLSGGVGTIAGTLVGGIIVGILQNILNLTNVSPYWQQILKGAVIMIAVIMDIKTKSAKTSS